ncbi:MAG: dimethyl sulfoxide reductase anchor subunit [Gammaproteobacteria bacterium]|nr:dimethyl sulfoxide reductase anchor subunit [Gammaproteobacteria bacterium]MBI5616035.1 dimethyl sulfoxide reductase anchor subunit [Gammaproteobacteria bacterium]
MTPAFSIIFFTTASGAGYGLLFVLSLLVFDRALPAAFVLTALAVALTLVSIGLVSSTFHLGHPERAWRALTQWRSSWLSREGVAALACYGPALALGAAVAVGAPRETVIALALATGVLAAATVYCTSMIYASLKTIAAWHDRRVPALYLLLGAMSGLLLARFLLAAFALPAHGLPWVTVAIVLSAAQVKRAYWRAQAEHRSASSLGTATGLDRLGRPRVLQPAHTERNFLLKEFGFEVGRRHASRLRRLAIAFAFGVPLALAALSALPAFALPAATAAVVSAAFGLVLERWLFFAEARHTVMLYYGGAAPAPSRSVPTTGG